MCFREIKLCIVSKSKSLTTWKIDWLGFNAVLTSFHSYHGGQFTYPCISWLSQSSSPHSRHFKNILAAFLHSPLVEDEWLLTHWLLPDVRKNVDLAGVCCRYLLLTIIKTFLSIWLSTGIVHRRRIKGMCNYRYHLFQQLPVEFLSVLKEFASLQKYN